MKKQLLFLVCLLSIIISHSQTFNDGVLEYTVTNGTNVSVKKYNTCPSGDLIIPVTVMHNGINYNVTSIIDNAFFNCPNLTSVVIPDGVISIGQFVFEDCTGLTSVTIPDSVNSIGSFAFASCSSLISITIPDGVTKIKIATFYSCSSLTNVIIPDTVTHIESEAFENCSNLSSFSIPNGVSNIGSSVFKNCSSLTSINIPDTVSFIGSNTFENCTGLISVTVNWPTPLIINPNAFAGVTIANIPLTVPVGTVAAYQAAILWRDFQSILNTSDFNTTILQVYPNPVNNHFTIQLENNTQLENVNIYNNLGQVVKESNSLTTHIDALSKGLYILEIETNQGKSAKKIIIE